MLDSSLLAVNLSEDFGTFYKRCLDALERKKTPRQCYCSSCTPKWISSGFWFGCSHGGNIYAVCHEFIDRYVKKLRYEIPTSVIQYEKRIVAKFK